MTNLEKVNNELKKHIIIAQTSVEKDGKEYKVRYGNNFYEYKGTLAGAIKYLVEYDFGYAMSWVSIRKQLAIIMIEELTGYTKQSKVRYWFWDSKKDLFEVSFDKDGKGVSYQEAFTKKSKFIPLDWLSYLHTAGEIFKGSV